MICILLGAVILLVLSAAISVCVANRSPTENNQISNTQEKSKKIPETKQPIVWKLESVNYFTNLSKNYEQIETNIQCKICNLKFEVKNF